MYVPCESRAGVCSGLRAEPFVDVADYIYKKKAPLDLSLQGIWIADREWPPYVYPSTRFTFVYLSYTWVGRCPIRDPCRRLCPQVRTRLCVQVRFYPLWI